MIASSPCWIFPDMNISTTSPRIDAPAMISRIVKRVAPFPAARAFVLCLALWLLIFSFCHFALWRDPHGAYFHSEHVYDQDYSVLRRDEARAFIESHSNATNPPPYEKAGDHPAICAAFVTVRGEHPDAARYFSDGIGSMLQGLSPHERAALNLRVLFANAADPSVHSDFDAPWVSQLIDHAAGYEGVSQTELEELRHLEGAEDFQRKGVLDYLYVLDQCYNETSAPFIAIFEDDIVFAADWLARTLLGLQYLAAEPPDHSKSPWLYLRLFYTETFMLWDEDFDYWYSHLPMTFVLISFTCATMLVAIRQILHGCTVSQDSQQPQKGRVGLRQALNQLGLRLDFPTIFVLSAIVAPAFTALTFMAGKYTLPMYAMRGAGRTVGDMAPGRDPLQWDAGVFPMDKQGCCTQALVFDRERVPDLMAYLKARGRGQTDLMIEDYCNETPMRRYALGEQAVQHVGIVSSRGMTTVNGQSVWAFYFEQTPADLIRARHQKVLEKIDWDVFQKVQDT